MKLFLRVIPIGCFAAVSVAPSSDIQAQKYLPPPKPKFKIDKRGGGDLYTTGSTVRVYEAPKIGARLLETYKPGAIMVLYGTAVGTPYVWVSPCNACDKGYALKSEFFRESTK